MKYFASPSFWEFYERLPSTVQELANKNFELLKQDANHPSLHLKKTGKYWSVRVGINMVRSGSKLRKIFSGSG